jgi:hypothetical protein
VSAYVEECRREWRRLGVPDLLADEMAADLEADLAEAQTDGVAADEILGESDPRRFAAAWASERGLVSEAAPKQKSRKRFWIVLAVGLVLVGFLAGVAGVVAFAKPRLSRVSRGQPVTVFPPVDATTVPALVGLKACRAERIAHLDGFNFFPKIPRHCNGLHGYVVVSQRPAAGAVVQRHSSIGLQIKRGPLRVPRLVGLNVCTAEQVLRQQGLSLDHFSRKSARSCRGVVAGQTPAPGHVVKPLTGVAVRLRGAKS